MVALVPRTTVGIVDLAADHDRLSETSGHGTARSDPASSLVVVRERGVFLNRLWKSRLFAYSPEGIMLENIP
jgi:hypothetical protein